MILFILEQKNKRPVTEAFFFKKRIIWEKIIGLKLHEEFPESESVCTLCGI